MVKIIKVSFRSGLETDIKLIFLNLFECKMSFDICHSLFVANTLKNLSMSVCENIRHFVPAIYLEVVTKVILLN